MISIPNYSILIVFPLVIALFYFGYIIGNKHVLPIAKTQKIFDDRYKKLSGTWYLYWLSYTPTSQDPVWMHGVCEFKVKGKYALGKVALINHPAGNVHFVQKGEFRNGNLILADACVENNDEFASIIYSNIENNECVVGIWNGFDNLGIPVAGPNIMSREQLSLDAINKMVSQGNLRLIVPGDYQPGWYTKISVSK